MNMEVYIIKQAYTGSPVAYAYDKELAEKIYDSAVALHPDQTFFIDVVREPFIKE